MQPLLKVLDIPSANPGHKLKTLTQMNLMIARSLRWVGPAGHVTGNLRETGQVLGAGLGNVGGYWVSTLLEPPPEGCCNMTFCSKESTDGFSGSGSVVGCK